MRKDVRSNLGYKKSALYRISESNNSQYNNLCEAAPMGTFAIDRESMIMAIRRQ